MLNVGLMLMASAAPTLLFGLIAGVFVDRYDRKTIMIVSVSCCERGLVALDPVRWSSARATSSGCTCIVLLSASVQQFFDPANDSVLPEIATDEELGAANSLMAIAQFGSTAIGFALAGLLTAQFSVELVFWIDAATFLFSPALLIALVTIPPLDTSRRRRRSATSFATWAFGAKFILETPVLRSMNLLRTPVMVIFGLQNVLLLPFAIQVLNADRVRVRPAGGHHLGRLRDRQPADGQICRSPAGRELAGPQLPGHGAGGARLCAHLERLGGHRPDRRSPACSTRRPSWPAA